MRRVGDDAHVEQERPLEELPHVVGRVDLFHLDLGVDVAVRQEVDVRVLHLGYRIRVTHLCKTTYGSICAVANSKFACVPCSQCHREAATNGT